MIRGLIYMMMIGLCAASCSSLKPVSTAKAPARNSENSPAFISNVSITAGSGSATNRTISKPASYRNSTSTSFRGAAATESLTSLQFKYGIMMDVAVEQLTNIKLLETIDEWYGARYRYGGTTKAGIDCSAFAGALMTAVFGSSLPRTAREQYAVTQRIRKDDLQEGDLVFFNTSGGISHVGIYLSNNKFVHASTSSGVMISDLNEPYYSRKYAGAGRTL